jgi:hypothetical protein
LFLSFCKEERAEQPYSRRWKVHHPLEDKHPFFLVRFVWLCEVFLGQCWRQSVQYCVSVPPSFMGYSNKFTCEYTMFPSTQLWRNLREQRPNNQGELDSSVTGEDGRVLHRGWPDSDFIFVL